MQRRLQSVEIKVVMEELKTAGTQQNRKIYARHGVTHELYGVSFANLAKLKKKIKVDHALAMALWATGVHDARILATMVADPAQADDAMLEAWAGDLGDYVITDAFSDYVFQTPLARQKMEVWIYSEDEWIGQAGWRLVAKFAMQDPDLPDAYFEDHLEHIEAEIHTRKNRVREAMNNALIAIGIRNTLLQVEALDAAGRIGKVMVDHGQTSCKTPDATTYILKTVKRREEKARGEYRSPL
jgi:3-methyladenine DNA glycosylase AlkD